MVESSLLWKVGLSGFGAALGLFFAIALAGASARPHTRHLAVFCLAFALTQAGDIAVQGVTGGAPAWTGQLGDAAFLLLAPALHAYVWTFTERRALPGRLLAIAVAPAAVALAWVLARIAAPPADAAPGDDFMPAAYTWSFLAVALVQLVGYAALSWQRVGRHGMRLRAIWSAPEAVAAMDLHWMRSLMVAASLAAVVWLAGLLVQHPVWRWLEALLPPALVLALGLQARRQAGVAELAGAPGIALGQDDDAVDADDPADAGRDSAAATGAEAGPHAAGAPEAAAHPGLAVEPAGRYARSGLGAERRRAVAARLEEFMRVERPFLEGDLTLQSLAQRLDVPAHHCSQVLNQEIGMSFFDYVNRWRVDEARRCLRDPAYAAQTVLDIGLAAGFNSKASFNASFKRLTGITPSAYRRAG